MCLKQFMHGRNVEKRSRKVMGREDHAEFYWPLASFLFYGLDGRCLENFEQRLELLKRRNEIMCEA